jgi:hypothetical protein
MHKTSLILIFCLLCLSMNAWADVLKLKTTNHYKNNDYSEFKTLNITSNQEEQIPVNKNEFGNLYLSYYMNQNKTMKFYFVYERYDGINYVSKENKIEKLPRYSYTELYTNEALLPYEIYSFNEWIIPGLESCEQDKIGKNREYLICFDLHQLTKINISIQRNP